MEGQAEPKQEPAEAQEPGQRQQQNQECACDCEGHPCLELELLYRHLMEEFKLLEEAWTRMQQRVFTAAGLVSVALSVFVGGNPEVLAYPLVAGPRWLVLLEAVFLGATLALLASFWLAVRPQKGPGLYRTEWFAQDYQESPCQLYARINSDLTGVIRLQEERNRGIARVLAWASYSAVVALVSLGVLVVLVVLVRA